MRERRGAGELMLLGLLAGCAPPPIHVIPPDVPGAADANALDAQVIADAPDISIADGAVLDSDEPTEAPDVASSDTPDAVDVAPVSDVSACARGETMCGDRCVDVTTDARHCGGCGRDCTGLPHVTGASVRCEAGECAVPAGACESGFAHCTTAALDGCETAIATPSDCGGCGVRCASSAPVCVRSAGSASCATGCSAVSPTLCAGSCVSTASSVSHCGGCGVTCPGVSHGTTTCRSGACGFECGSGYHQCDDHCADDASPRSCGGSCIPCGAPSNATPTCAVGVCAWRCDAGFHACAGACVSDVAVSSCGASCASCAAPANGVATCDGVRCGFACAAGFRSEGTVCVPVAAPRLVAPLSTTRVTSQQPTLQWQLAGGTDGARVELCRDRACATIEQTLTATGASVRVPTGLAAGVHFWRARGRAGASEGGATSAVWEFFVGFRSAPHDASYGGVSDVNGDGLADVLVASPGNGALYIYPGRRGGVVATERATITPPSPASAIATVTVGDVNGDGFGDAVVGAPGASCAYVYPGSASGLIPEPSQRISGAVGSGLGGARIAGDVNGDGYADVLIAGGASGRGLLFYGSQIGLPSTPSFTGPEDSGASIAPIGDVNGDGLADIVFIIGYSMSFYYGSRTGLTTPDRRWTFAFDMDHRPAAFSIGDVNGDGFNDLLIETSTNDGVSVGRNCDVWFGSASGLPTSPVGSLRSFAGVSCPMGTGGDGNADGYTDLVHFSQDGTVSVLMGTATGVAATGRVISVANDFAFPATSMAFGDVNGDSVDDLVLIGQRSAGVGRSLQIHHGSSSHWPAAPSSTLPLPAASTTSLVELTW